MQNSESKEIFPTALQQVPAGSRSRITALLPKVLLVTLLLWSGLQNTSLAQFNYTNTGGGIAITRYTGPVLFNKSGTALIQYPAARFGDSYLIPSWVTDIADWSFAGCLELTNITIPQGVNSLGSHAFAGCQSLVSASIGQGIVNLPDNAFANCPKLTDIRIPGSLTSIGSQAFYGCGNLRNIIIPSSVLNMGLDAFGLCKNLLGVYFEGDPPSLPPPPPPWYPYAETGIFSGDDALTVYYTPGTAGWTSQFSDRPTLLWNPRAQANGAAFGVGTGRFAFNIFGTSGLTIITEACQDLANPTWLPVSTNVLTGGSAYVSDALWRNYTNRFYRFRPPIHEEQAQALTYITNNGTITLTGYTGPAGKLTIPDTISGLPVTAIGGYAFSGCTSAQDLAVPQTVTQIGPYAFTTCTNLINIVIPDSVTDIGAGAFGGCTSLTNINIPASVTSIGTSAFNLCSSLTAITVDAQNSSYSSLDGVLFNKDQTALLVFPPGKAGAYTIPSTVISFGQAFTGCSNVNSIIIPMGITSIPDHAFENCELLSSVTIPVSVTDIGSSAFASCFSLFDAPMGQGVISIGDGAYYHCISLATATIPPSVTTIGAGAFQVCLNLRKVTIPNSVTNIGPYSFQTCINLETLVLPSSLTEIEVDMFVSCSSLSTVYFRGNAPGLNGPVFDSTANVTVYYLPGTTGWSATFAGRPAVLWNPLIQTVDGRLGLGQYGFGFGVRGTPEIPIVVEACTNLTSGSWVPLLSRTLTKGLIYFSDPQWNNYPARFYRIRSP